MLLESEIAEEYPVDNKEILTPTGWKRIRTAYKTVPLPVWVLSTPTRALRASGHHLVRSYRKAGDTEYRCHRICTLSPGDWVETEDGAEKIVGVFDTGEQEELYDITIDSADGLFYSNGIVSHNSTTMVTRQLMMSHLMPKYKSLYVVPYHEQLKTYADRYLEMEHAFRGNTGKQNLYNKIYSNGSSVDMHYALTDASKIRGKTVTECVIDEAQNMDPNLVPEILYTMTTSKLATTVYAGTALTIDTLLEDKWQKSSMGMWMVRDGTGSGWLNMYDRKTLWDVCENPDGPRCPKTKKLLNMTDGCFVHANNQALEAGRVGIHVPQCIIQDFAKDPVQWGRIYNNIKTQDARKVLQECFGIAVAEGARELTVSDLERICVIKESDEELKEKCLNGYYATVISGCDWGGSDYNPATKTKTSYTVHCVIGLAPDGFVDILHFRKWAGMGYADIADELIREHRDWHARAIASDFGVGAFYNTELRKHIPLGKHFILGYSGPKTAPFAPVKESNLAYHFSVNRNEAISRVFTDVKAQPMLRIRARTWDVMGEYLTDWLNVYRSLKELQSGERTFNYIRQPTKPDDCLHAFTFAYMLMRLFKGEPIIQDLSVQNHIRMVLGSSSQQQATVHATRSVLRPQNYVISG